MSFSSSHRRELLQMIMHSPQTQQCHLCSALLHLTCQVFVKGKFPLLVVKPPGQGYGEATSSRLSWNSSSFVWPLNHRISAVLQAALLAAVSGITANTYFGFLERSLCISPLSIMSRWRVAPKEWESKACRSRSSGKNLRRLKWILPKRETGNELNSPRETPCPGSAVAVQLRSQ